MTLYIIRCVRVIVGDTVGERNYRLCCEICGFRPNLPYKDRPNKNCAKTLDGPNNNYGAVRSCLCTKERREKGKAKAKTTRQRQGQRQGQRQRQKTKTKHKEKKIDTEKQKDKDRHKDKDKNKDNDRPDLPYEDRPNKNCAKT